MKKNKKNYLYTPYFCEENIWFLGESLIKENFSSQKMFVLFLTNPLQQIVLWNQVGANQENYIVWDYHVILSLFYQNKLWIFDFDSKNNFPECIYKYLKCTFCNEFIRPQYHAQIRIVPLQKYHEYFSSDRSHMLDSEKKPLKLFPKWNPIISTKKSKILLQSYLNFNKESPRLGKVFDYQEFQKFIEDMSQKS